MFKTRLPLTAGLMQKREQKLHAKAGKLYEKIMRDHGIDAKEKAEKNRIIYDIPNLMDVKTKTSGNLSVLQELFGIKQEPEPSDVPAKLTKQVPFNL